MLQLFWKCATRVWSGCVRLKLNIKSLKSPLHPFKANEIDHSKLLRLLSLCDTSNLGELQFCVRHGSPCYGSPPSKTQFAEEGCSATRAPLSSFLDEVATQCPNLETVIITLSVDGYRTWEDPMSTSPLFFSMATIKSLTINLDRESAPPLPNHGMFFCRMVENLSNLQYLFLVADRQELGNTVYHIRSNSLKQLWKASRNTSVSRLIVPTFKFTDAKVL